ncbi:TIGR03759 family integrating conjugative element protein [Pseudomonas sp. KFB-139]|uniref:TIGR03759 family integrating conjugative element protein n=1 Tax=Pseudomonas serbiensis TaxID=3064350 RepID=A0ABT9CQG6_9PSED|nr:TIGR03759 family integrating conjugative element protein [Pseudomonas sp. KFB-138]MDO7927735.1 TIGR03759 family integrating conjugative element protein [Pseudomonas sp. KFB-138]
MLNKLLHIALALAGIFITTVQAAEPGSLTYRNSANAGLNTQNVPSEARAREWNLDEKEWDRYQSLMQGSRGIYSPGLDPLTALGIEARTDEERRRYAELQVKAEAQRTAKELAYQRAYDDAFKRLYPNLLPIQPDGSVDTGSSAGVKAAVRGNGRLAVFVKDGCSECSIRIKSLLSQNQEFDVYMIGSQGDDARIRNWAIQAGVDVAVVRKRQVTLNHDAGRWLSLGLGGELPAVVREVNGQWLRQ